jgi:hypothetical protein
MKTSQRNVKATVMVLAMCSGMTCLTGSPEAAEAEKKDKPRIEVCFVLDTTSSMSGLIEGAKQKIWSIANEMVSAKPTPEIRLALIGYRDRGDAYVTKRFDLTNDIDAVYANLQGFRAEGGGDTPESVNQALHEAVTKVSWSADRQVLKIVFLVGDSPPHMDYAEDMKYPEVCQLAAKRDLIINTIQCEKNPETTTVWRKVAELSEGKFAAVAQSGGMVAIATPMDGELAELNRKLGGTFIAYGGAGERRAFQAKLAASESAPASVAADRLSFYSVSEFRADADVELLGALNAGRVKLDSVKKEQLSDDLRKLDAAALKAEVEKRQKERTELQAKIQTLTKAREDYLAQERKRLAATGKSDSFDETVTQTIRAQAARKGIHYGK